MASELSDVVSAHNNVTYQRQRILGKGGFGVVYRTKKTPNDCGNDVCALKMIPIRHNDDNLKMIEREVKTLQLLDHPRIVKYNNTFNFSGCRDGLTYLCIEMPVYEVDLSMRLDYLIARGKHVPVSDLCRYALQILGAVQYLHDNKVIHRDLKLENICLTTDFQDATIIDFGLVRSFTDDGTNTQTFTACGSRCNMSPEMANLFNGVTLHGIKIKYDIPVDIWAIGIMLFELMSNRTRKERNQTTLLSILIGCGSDEVKFHSILRKSMEKFPSSIVEFTLFSFLREDPKDRSTAKDALSEFQNSVHNSATTSAIEASAQFASELELKIQEVKQEASAEITELKEKVEDLHQQNDQLQDQLHQQVDQLQDQLTTSAAEPTQLTAAAAEAAQLRQQIFQQQNQARHFKKIVFVLVFFLVSFLCATVYQLLLRPTVLDLSTCLKNQDKLNMTIVKVRNELSQIEVVLHDKDAQLLAKQTEIAGKDILLASQNDYLKVKNALEKFESEQNKKIEEAKNALEKVESDQKKIIEERTTALATLQDNPKVLKFLSMNTIASPAEIEKALHKASSDGEVKVVQFLLLQNAEVDAIDAKGRTALHWAARNGCDACIKALHDFGADMNKKDSISYTPMHYAALRGHVACMKTLHGFGADVNTKDDYGDTPMHNAARVGNANCIQMLYDLNADISAHNNGRTPLDVANQLGNKSAIDLLKKLVATKH